LWAVSYTSCDVQKDDLYNASRRMEGGSGRGNRVGKGEGALDLDICPWATSS